MLDSQSKMHMVQKEGVKGTAAQNHTAKNVEEIRQRKMTDRLQSDLGELKQQHSWKGKREMVRQGLAAQKRVKKQCKNY